MEHVNAIMVTPKPKIKEVTIGLNENAVNEDFDTGKDLCSKACKTARGICVLKF